MPIMPSLRARRGDTTERGGRVAVLACGDQSLLRLAEGDSAETRRGQEAYQVSAAIRCTIAFFRMGSGSLSPALLPCVASAARGHAQQRPPGTVKGAAA